MKRVGIALMVSLILASVFIAPAMAMGPQKSKGKKVVRPGNYVMIVSNRGWRQWKDNYDDFAVCLFTEGMNQDAIDSHLAEGWRAYTISTGDVRYSSLLPYVDAPGPIGIIYKVHIIPAE